MTHKLVRRLVLLVTLSVVFAALGFALVVSYTPRLSGMAMDPEAPIRALAPKVYPVPHPVDTPRFATCGNCHGPDSRFASPANHQSFGERTCALCHAFPQDASAEQASARPPEQGGEPRAHGFGWRTALGEAAKRDFNLPDPCVLLSTLEQIVTGEHCSVRPDGLACVECHRAERADAGVRLDNLEDKQDLIDRGYITGFVSERSAKPPHLKRLFADWQARGYPD